jgi:acyl transferase domain-containing protein
MALAGGVNLMAGIHNYLDLGKAGFLSSTGQCKPFDENADGYCRAEGAGLVVLKLLKDAISEGDQILGVIPGIATNQGGLSPSITIPSSSAQIQLYRTILSQAQMRSDQVNYVEAHGTGTQAGDPVELASIREVFGGPRRSNPLHIGSTKGNIGHCETTAGVAGLIKVLAMINEESIPPLANFKKLNPKIPALEPDSMCIDLEVKQWDAPLRTACVSSYGAAGSNTALLCCEYPQYLKESNKESPPPSTTYPIILSAASKESLAEYSEVIKAFLHRKVQNIQFANLAFTLSERRKHHRFRWVTTANSTSDILRALDRNIQNSIIEVPKQSKRVVLVFSGQSKQNIGLDKTFFDANSRFQYYILKCNDYLTKVLGFPSIIPAIFQPGPLDDVVVLQCGTFALQYACARCWMDAGLHIDMTIGHTALANLLLLLCLKYSL